MWIKSSTNIISISNLIKSQQTVFLNPIKPALFTLFGDVNVRHAGHSKWQNIRHTKAAKDRQKSITFNFYVGEINKACIKASTDPKINDELAKIIKQAQQTANMPSSTINKVLKRIETRKLNPMTVKYAYRGPNGLIMLIIIMSDNPSRTKGDINKLIKKSKIPLTMLPGDPVSAFEAKGWVFAKPQSGISDVADKSLEDAIEVGAEEVGLSEENPEILKFICDVPELNKVRSKLETRNYKIEDAYEMYNPRAPVELNDQQMQLVQNLIDELEELDEMERIYVNIM